MTTCHTDAVGRLIYVTTMAMKNCLEMRFKPYDLTTEQFHVLKSLGEESGVAQNRLCELVEKSPANMTRILDRLEKKECIVRCVNPEDRRSTLVHLTETGEALLEEVRGELTAFEHEITVGLSDEQVQDIKGGLKVMLDNIEKISKINSGCP